MRRLGAVGIVLLGLYVMSQTAYLIAYQIIEVSTFTLGSLGELRLLFTWILSTLLYVVYFAAGVYLIAARQWLAARWFEDGPADVTAEPTMLLRLGFIILGVSLIASSASYVVGEVVSKTFSMLRDGNAASWGWGPFARAATQLGFGLGLVFASSQLSQWLLIARRAPLDGVEQAPQPDSALGDVDSAEK